QRPSSTMTGTRSERPPVRSRMPVNPPGTISISNPLCLSAYLVDQTNGLMVQPDASCRSKSVMVLSVATGDSDLELLERRRIEQLLGREPPRTQSLCVVMAQESVEHMPIRLQSVTPIVMSHERTRRVQVRLEERQAHLCGCGVRQRLDRTRLRFGERLEQRTREPGMLGGKRAANAEHVHDRKYPGALVVPLCCGCRIAEQRTDRGKAPLHDRRRPRGDKSVELSGREHHRKRAVGRCILQRHRAREVQRDLLFA